MSFLSRVPQTLLPFKHIAFQIAIWCIKDSTSLVSPHIVAFCLIFSQRLWKLPKFPEEADCDIGIEAHDLRQDCRVPVGEIVTSKELHSDIQG